MATKSSTQEMESLVINKVASPAVYQSMVTNNQINENELYLVMGDENVTYTLAQNGDTITLTGSDGSTSSVLADASGAASSAVSTHNSSASAHSDIRNAIPTTTSQLTNDSGFITSSDIPEGSTASSTTPAMDGAAAVGTELAFARGDHVHPTDTSRAPTSHASTAATYGAGTSSNYGHVKLTDSLEYSFSSKSASGDVVTFSDGYNTAASAMAVTMATTQSGSGDPSPTNIRPISGFTGANIYVSHTSNSEDGTTYPVSWIHADTDTGDPAGNYYVSQGSLDVMNGTLTVNAILNVFETVSATGTIVSKLWSLAPNATSIGTVGDYTRISFSNRSEVDRTQYSLTSNSYSTKACNMLKHVFSYADESASWYINSGTLYAKFPTSLVGSTASSVVAYLTSIKDTTPLSILIPLASPITYQLTATQVNTLLGTNYVWSDAGDISLTYTAASSSSGSNGIAATPQAVLTALMEAKTYADGLTYSDVGAAASSHGHDEATVSAAGFMSASDKTKLNSFLDEDLYMAFRGYAVGSSEFNTALSDITAEGHYHILIADLASITDLPDDFDMNSGAHLIVWDATDGSSTRRFQILMDVNGGMWQRFVSASSGVSAWIDLTGLYGESDLIGRNLIKNTLVPNVGSNATLPMLVGQTEETKTTTGTWSVAEHGFRLTNTGNQRPIIRFGANTVADGTMNGLTAGETYTMSFDYACQLYGGYSGSSNVFLRVYLYSNAASASAFGIDSSANVATYSSGEYGNVKTGSCTFTFTIPSAATMIDFRIQANETTNSYFPSGSYVELSNFKLEKGYRATAWYPAIEDLDKHLPTNRAVTLTTAGWSSNAQTVTVTGVSATESSQLITITPAIASQSDYLAAGVKATAQAANSITFSCDTTPTAALTVYVTIQEAAYAS